MGKDKSIPITRFMKASIFGGLLISLSANASWAQTQDIKILVPPIPQYPAEAAGEGIEGRCEVSFSVNKRGLPVEIEASCTQSIFCAVAARAVRDAAFSPAMLDGVPIKRTNIVYPLSFGFDDTTYHIVPDPHPLKSCESIGATPMS